MECSTAHLSYEQTYFFPKHLEQRPAFAPDGIDGQAVNGLVLVDLHKEHTGGNQLRRTTSL